MYAKKIKIFANNNFLFYLKFNILKSKTKKS